MSWSCLYVDWEMHNALDATEFATSQTFCFWSMAFCSSLNEHAVIPDKLKIALFFKVNWQLDQLDI